MKDLRHFFAIVSSCGWKVVLNALSYNVFMRVSCNVAAWKCDARARSRQCSRFVTHETRFHAAVVFLSLPRVFYSLDHRYIQAERTETAERETGGSLFNRNRPKGQSCKWYLEVPDGDVLSAAANFRGSCTTKTKTLSKVQAMSQLKCLAECCALRHLLDTGVFK